MSGFLAFRMIIKFTRQIFDLIYHGNGGFTHSDVYNFPVWKKLLCSKIIDFKTEEKKEHDKEMRKMKAKCLVSK